MLARITDEVAPSNLPPPLPASNLPPPLPASNLPPPWHRAPRSELGAGDRSDQVTLTEVDDVLAGLVAGIERASPGAAASPARGRRRRILSAERLQVACAASAPPRAASAPPRAVPTITR